jgi:chromatin remodeling complex protein RSC6
MERFDHATAADADATPPSPHTNGAAPAARQKEKKETSEEEEDEDAPPKKKRKQSKSKVDDADAKLAALLQAQEDSRTRSTRGGGAKKKAPVKKRTPKKKSSDKVKAEDDSDIELDSDGVAKEKVKKGGFHKQYNLSHPLADLVGATTVSYLSLYLDKPINIIKLSRPQVVKKIWEYIKERNLQEPTDKRQIRCDERMQQVFKQDNVHMFTMNKILGKHLYDLEE